MKGVYNDIFLRLKGSIIAGILPCMLLPFYFALNTACCVNDKCPSKNVRRFEINLMAPNVQKDRLFERQLKKFIIDTDYYDTLLGFSLISCDACQHWGIEWTRIPQPYSVNPSTRNMDADFKAAQFATRYADRRY